jgi:Ser-tRNA(Ala) deacylase AlaX
MPPEIKTQLKSPITWAWLGPVLLSIVLALSAYSFLSTVEAAKRDIATVNLNLTEKQKDLCNEVSELQKSKLDKEQYYRDQAIIQESLRELTKDVKMLVYWNVPKEKKSK